ncbi:MAG: prenyltransferase/squalene oxidase repeat-containing protein, partial [Gemmatimonadaceae bacterium]
MLTDILQFGRRLLFEQRLPPLVKQERRRDRATPLEPDPGIDAAVRGALAWLARAQDHSASADGGAARNFSLISGWSTSYPETSGYIVPTLLDCARRYDDPEFRDRARRMLDWLVTIQFPEGGFQGGTVDATPRVPVTFNTGQIVLGLAAGARELGDAYRDPMRRAADWLAQSQDADGCWRKHRTPFAKPSDKAYETHVSWGLYEAARVEHVPAWVEAANRQVRWAMGRQQANGWFAENCLTDP